MMNGTENIPLDLAGVLRLLDKKLPELPGSLTSEESTKTDQRTALDGERCGWCS